MSELCARCLDTEWVCEIHTTKPWSGVIGDERGCEPDCLGPGVPCPDCLAIGRWGIDDGV